MTDKKVYENELVYDLPNDEYHAMEGISKSNLDLINKSPAHYKYSLEHPTEQTDAMFVGSAVHTAILEPELFAKEYIVAPKIDRRTKVGKEEYAAFQEANGSKITLDTPTFEMISRMSEKVNSIPLFQSIMKDAKVEVSAFFKDSGILRKSRADIYREDGILADLKTCQDASYEAIQRSIYSWRYYVQSPYYLDNFSLVTKRKYDQFIFIFVEKTPPHGVAFYAADRQMLERGRMEYKANLDTYMKCMETDEWPDYEQKIMTVSLPKWAK